MKLRPNIKILILAILITASKQTLKLISNQRLIKEISSIESPKNISYALSTFGSIPYGMNILGFAHFDTANQYGCESTSLTPYSDKDVMPFMIVRRGECQFISKVIIIFTKIGPKCSKSRCKSFDYSRQYRRRIRFPAFSRLWWQANSHSFNDS